MIEISWSWIFVLSLPLAYIFLTPLITLLTFGQDANPDFQAVGDDVSLPEDARSFFFSTHEQFTRLGFENVGTFWLPNQMVNVRAGAAMFVHRQKTESALSLVVYGNVNSKWTLQAAYTEFETTFADHTSVSTGNQKQPGAYPHPPDDLRTMHPGIQDISTLRLAHQALQKSHGGSRQIIFPLDRVFDGDAVAYLTHGMRQECEYARQCGYLRLNETAPVDRSTSLSPYQTPAAAERSSYTTTIKGAYVMTWQELFPFKQIRRAWCTRRSRHQLEATGFRMPIVSART